jgi:hypothetical protein
MGSGRLISGAATKILTCIDAALPACALCACVDLARSGALLAPCVRPLPPTARAKAATQLGLCVGVPVLYMLMCMYLPYSGERRS